MHYRPKSTRTQGLNPNSRVAYGTENAHTVPKPSRLTQSYARGSPQFSIQIQMMRMVMRGKFKGLHGMYCIAEANALLPLLSFRVMDVGSKS
jgi:hypothetical protein